MSDIIDIVDDQPKPLIFFKSLLELNGTNMTSVLSFDSRSMKFLLDAEAFGEYFDPTYPMFYKNKFFKNKNPRQEKLFYRSAFDNALRNNQTGAIKFMIQYICQYQNNKVTSFLFLKNMPDMIEKGVSIIDLLKSQIFSEQFDYDEWPGTHWNDECAMKPYTGSIFRLRNEYNKIFPGRDYEPMPDEDDE